jgi:hypothetical protein
MVMRETCGRWVDDLVVGGLWDGKAARLVNMGRGDLVLL